MNVKRFIWALFMSRNYKESKSLTEAVYCIINVLNTCESVSVNIEYYNIYINSEHLSVELWNANQYHAWLSRGCINGVSFDNIMPSSRAIYDFKECLKKHGHEIKRPENKPPIFDLSKIKC